MNTFFQPVPSQNKHMVSRITVLAAGILLLVGFFFPSDSIAQSKIIREGIKITSEMVAKWTGRFTARELAELGERELVEQMIKQSLEEGGEELAQRVIQLSRTYGKTMVDLIAKSPKILASAFDSLPAQTVKEGMWLVKGNPARYTTLIEKYGSNVLPSLVKHPSVGIDLVEKFGDDGVRVLNTLTREQGLSLAKYASRLAAESPSFRKVFFDELFKYTERLVAMLNKNYKFVITAGGLIWLNENGERILGGYSEIDGSNGAPSSIIAKPGIIERILLPYRFYIGLFLVLYFGFILIRHGLKTWGEYQKVRQLSSLSKNRDMKQTEE